MFYFRRAGKKWDAGRGEDFREWEVAVSKRWRRFLVGRAAGCELLYWEWGGVLCGNVVSAELNQII